MFFVDEAGKPLDALDVSFRAGGTILRQYTQEISYTSTYGIGDVNPWKSLYSLKIPGLPNYTAEWVAGTRRGELNPIVLCEVYDYRFEDGSYLLDAEGSGQAAFVVTQDTRVYAVDEDGKEISESDFKASSPRVNRLGCFVVDIKRNGDHEKHIALVVSKLQLKLEHEHKAGDEITIDVSGAAISGMSMSDLMTIVKFVKKE
jgi:hypothetical protein